MKIFCFNFLVYIVLLLTQPCPDVFGLDVETVRSSTLASHIHKDRPSESPTDECSPFCTCSCCCHPVANDPLSFGFSMTPEELLVERISIEYSKPNPSQFAVAIWQPPKASVT